MKNRKTARSAKVRFNKIGLRLFFHFIFLFFFFHFSPPPSPRSSRRWQILLHGPSVALSYLPFSVGVVNTRTHVHMCVHACVCTGVRTLREAPNRRPGGGGGGGRRGVMETAVRARRAVAKGLTNDPARCGWAGMVFGLGCGESLRPERIDRREARGARTLRAVTAVRARKLDITRDPPSARAQTFAHSHVRVSPHSRHATYYIYVRICPLAVDRLSLFVCPFT